MNSLFALFSVGAWVSAALVLNSKNPVHAVFYLVLVFLHASGLLCLLGLEYFALLQLLVYIGALAIMFLFVVMLLDIPVTEIVAYQRGTYPVAGILTFCLLISIWFALWQPYWDVSWIFLENSFFSRNFEKVPFDEISKNQMSFVSPLLPNDLWSHYSVSYSWESLANTSTPIAQLGVALYGVHVDLLILASFVLLVAMIGAVALTLKRRISAPVHDVFAQHNRDFQKVILEVKQ
jgi:NADH:ubiquinone oxidoreductase subunit 6 (subunit J)